MHPDIARADRTQQRIGNGMERDIGVAMARQPLVMRDPHTAEPQLLPGFEAVDVEAHRTAGDERGGMTRLGSGKIGGVGDFFEHGVSGHQHDVMAQAAEHLGIVGGFFGIGPGAMRGEDDIEVKGLRRLNAVQASTGDIIAKGVGAFRQRVGDGEDRDGAWSVVECGEQGVNHCGGDEGTGGVVDQNSGHAFVRERLQPGTDGVAAPPVTKLSTNMTESPSVERAVSCCPSAMTTMVSVIAGCWDSAVTLCERTDFPHSGANCLGSVPPARTPFPAATMRAAIVTRRR